MSKAFTRESDDATEEPAGFRRPSPLPPGVKNYITADGARQLQKEMDRLTQIEKERSLSEIGDGQVRPDSVAMKQRIFHLRAILESLVVVPEGARPSEEIRFGAFVTVRDGHGVESQFRIVGVDEIDIDRGWISWRSPIARALLNHKAGDRVVFQLPGGQEEVVIVRVSYDAPIPTNVVSQ